MKIYLSIALTILLSCTYLQGMQSRYEVDQTIYAQEHLLWQAEQERVPQFLSSLYTLATHAIKEAQKILGIIPHTIASLLIPANPHKDDIALVRHTDCDELCAQELAFLENRQASIKKGVQKLLDDKANADGPMPRIGLCFSGGGFRAMLTTLGFLQAAEDIGLLDASSYMAGLSGSTWAIGPWIASGKTLTDFKADLINHIKNGLHHINEPGDLRLLLSNLLSKIHYGQCISAIDIYGAVLVNTLLHTIGSTRLSLTLTESHKDVIHGSVPLPIYTSIKTNPNPYEWMEITPFEVGSTFLQAYVPTWAYGRKFENGVSVDQLPEQTLGYYLGIFGSAFELNFSDLLRFTTANLSSIKHSLPTFLDTLIDKIIKIILESPLSNFRLFPSMLHNFTHQAAYSPLHKDETLCLVDAGIDFNIAIPPLLRKQRNVDIIIIYDSSADIAGAPELRRLQAYAQRKGLPLPPIDFDTVDTHLVSIFQDDTLHDAPIVVYFPCIKNPSYAEDFDPATCIKEEYCGTLNFAYTQDQVNKLSGLGDFTLKQHMHLIRKIVKECMERKQLT